MATGAVNGFWYVFEYKVEIHFVFLVVNVYLQCRKKNDIK